MGWLKCNLQFIRIKTVYIIIKKKVWNKLLFYIWKFEFTILSKFKLKILLKKIVTLYFRYFIIFKRTLNNITTYVVLDFKLFQNYKKIIKFKISETVETIWKFYFISFSRLKSIYIFCENIKYLYLLIFELQQIIRTVLVRNLLC